MTDWIKRLEDTWGGMTPDPWEAQEPAFCPNFGKAKIWPLKIEGKYHNFAMIKQKDAEGIVSLANLRHELLALVKAAQEATEACPIHDLYVENTFCSCSSKQDLWKALTALRAKVEGEG